MRIQMRAMTAMEDLQAAAVRAQARLQRKGLSVPEVSVGLPSPVPAARSCCPCCTEWAGHEDMHCASAFHSNELGV